MSNIGEILETARRASGMTQAELARRAGVTQAALSRYENDQREPEPDVLTRLAKALGVTESFLQDAGRVHGATAVDAHMRRMRTAKPTVWRKWEARLNMYRLHTRSLFEEVSLRAEQQVPRLDPVETDPATAARLVRMQWRMPVGPVRSLTKWLEAAGCLIIEEDFGTPRIDGMSQWIGDHPILLINSRVPTDRKRRTLAHELGHLCLHSFDVSAHIEEEADAFATELLTPADVIRAQLRNLTVGRLLDLKRYWGVSMQSLVERAHNLGRLTAEERTRIYKTMSARGWRTNEPASDELPDERPQLTHEIGEALRGRGLVPNEIARLAGYADASLPHPFQAAPQRLHAI